MRVDDYRLIKAARRTLRAEATLLVVVLLISAWSIYAIYKFSVGSSDSIFGFSLRRQVDTRLNSAASSPDRINSVSRGQFDEHRLPGDSSGSQITGIASYSQALNQQRDVGLQRSFSPAIENKLAKLSATPRQTTRRRSLSIPEAPKATNYEENIDDKLRVMKARKLFAEDESEDERDFGESRDTNFNLNPLETGSEPSSTSGQDQPIDYPTTMAVGSSESAELQTEEPDSEESNLQRPPLPGPESAPEHQTAESGQNEPEGAEDQEAEEAEEETAKRDAGRAIDEEVDRMTQPSLGFVTQQERPALRSSQDIVQFDDEAPKFTSHKGSSNNTRGRGGRENGSAKDLQTADLYENDTLARLQDAIKRQQNLKLNSKLTDTPVLSRQLHRVTRISNPQSEPQNKGIRYDENELDAGGSELNESRVLAPTGNGTSVGDLSSQGNPLAADTSLYTVDHGLLLYPAEDEHHYERGMKRKKGAGQKKKATIAYKKGGSKKKKHKKEEKKLIKEKKFKGAKKGKKVKKGKGGQGGKKGKKHFKDKGFKKKGFKNVYHKEEYGQKKSYFDEFRDKDFKKKWKKYDDNYKYAQMKKWQAKDVKGAKKLKDHGEKMKKYDKSRWKKTYQKDSKEHKEFKKDSF